MINYVYDGTFLGLLTVVFESYKSKIFPNKIYKKNCFQLDLTIKNKEIITSLEKANRVKVKLLKLLEKNNYNQLKVAFFSTLLDKDLIIFYYIKEIIDCGLDVSNNYQNSNIFAYSVLIKKVKFEVHRFLGFIRFSQLDNGIYYAVFEPDNLINELILPHFIKRYKTMPFILHDVKNGVISWYNTKNYKTIYKKIPKLNSKDEFEKLFKTYYESVNIKSRKNTRNMFNFMPKRYHKNLPEKNELL